MSVLHIRSGRNRPDLVPVLADFEAATGIRVAYEKVYHRDVGARSRAEAGRPTADVLITNSRIALEGLRDHDVFVRRPPAIADALGPDLRAPDFAWVAFTAWPRVAMVHLGVLPDPAGWPRGLEDLAAPAWRGRVACAAMVEMTTVSQFASLAVARDLAFVGGLLDRLVANGLRILPSNLATREALVREPLALGLANASNVHVFRGEGHPVAEAWLDQEEGGLGTAVEAHAVAVLRGTPRATEAGLFVDWLLSVPVQEELARRYGETPVNPLATCGTVRPLAAIRATPAPLPDLMAAIPAVEDLLRRKGFDVRAT